MCLSKNIRYLRKRYDMSQDALAEYLGYKSYTTIQKWETGVSEPPIKQLRKMADLFGEDIDDMAKIDLERRDFFPDEFQLPGGPYYVDPNTASIAQKVYDNPSLRLLFEAAQGVSSENIELAAEMLKRFKETNPNG